MWGEMEPWVWVGLAASLIAAVIIAVRHAEQQDPSLEEQRSDFAQLLPKDPPVVIDRRFASYRRASGLFDVEDK
jgi:negative regulator of sigma E activity